MEKCFVFIYGEPYLILNITSKAEGVNLIKEYFKKHYIVSNGQNVSQFVLNANYSSLARLLFYTEIKEYSDNIIFHTYKTNKGSLKEHIHYYTTEDGSNIKSFHESYYLLNEKIHELFFAQYKEYKANLRKLKIQKLLENGR